ncbi:hypothetical protein Ddye_005397 [Dipteronia dyeriana]|uniref:MULE transposase domain-containing protein n=1 Tax=Dipteronia dyeriana TaxID=168575 RepID=A0AAD9XG66_9ROSI|nr:hypothetical protein Ddye_005397 [Dipteronia dyeriana]
MEDDYLEAYFVNRSENEDFGDDFVEPEYQQEEETKVVEHNDAFVDNGKEQNKGENDEHENSGSKNDESQFNDEQKAVLNELRKLDRKRNLKKTKVFNSNFEFFDENSNPRNINLRVGQENSYYPIAYAVVERESYYKWKWFLEFLKIDLNLNQLFSITFMTDKQKGIVEAINELWRGSEHISYVRHMYANFKKKFKGHLIRNNVWQAVKASTKEEWEDFMEKIKNLNHQLVMNQQPTWNQNAETPVDVPDIQTEFVDNNEVGEGIMTRESIGQQINMENIEQLLPDVRTLKQHYATKLIPHLHPNDPLLHFFQSENQVEKE